MNLNEKIGGNIKRAREEQHLLQKDVYERLEMKKSTYSDIETGNVSITVENLYKIAEVLQIPVQKLLDIKDSNIMNGNYKSIFIAQNHNGNVTLHLTKEIIEELNKDDK